MDSTDTANTTDTTGITATHRRIDLVLDTLDLPGDGQVDRKRIVLRPGTWELFDPFLMMAEDWFTQPGFDWHPHRGMETVTFVLAGSQRHGDSLGNEATLGPGDAQWMTAGRGIIHRELADGDAPVHSLQLWVNLPAREKLRPPRFQDLRRGSLPSVTSNGATVTVYAGRHEQAQAPTELVQPASLVDVELDGSLDGSLDTVHEGVRVDHRVEPGWRAIAYVLGGHPTIGGVAVGEGQVAVSHPSPGPDLLRIESSAPARVLVFAGLPIGEPVVQRGPFVMNTEDEIQTAVADFRAGRLAPLPVTT